MGRRDLAGAVARVGAGYVLADLAESALKGAVGRERPHVSGRPWRFDPFSRDGDEHSFPSAHVTHAMAVAAGIARETRHPALAAAAFAAATTVAWQRVHEDQHWLSDVGAAAAIAIGAQDVVRATRWSRSRASLVVTPGAVAVRVAGPGA
jgi:membrane-associated phospholipid phosphatase